MNTRGSVSCKCNLHENFSQNANTNKEISGQRAICDQNSIFKGFMILCEMLLRHLVPFVQFKKRKKKPWSSVTFSKVAC